jgi:hypothetical protein
MAPVFNFQMPEVDFYLFSLHFQVALIFLAG